MRWAYLAGMVPRLRTISPKEKIGVSVSRLEGHVKRLRAARALFVRRRMDALETAAGRLELVSPLAVLARGYSLVRKEPDGALVKKAGDVKEKESVRIRLSEGGLLCRVEQVFPEGEGPMSTGNESTNPDAEPKSFEAALERLEVIVEKLEEGEPSLEEAVSLYEEGVKLFRYSREQLNAAQKRVEELVGESEETFLLQPFEDGEDDE